MVDDIPESLPVSFSARPDPASGSPEARRRRVAPQGARSAGDRNPPHSPEAERGVLGCVIVSPRDCLTACVEELHGSVEGFYDLRHQEIYKAACAIADSGNTVDVIALFQKLKDGKMLDSVGGIAYLNQLQDEVPSAANLRYYLDIVNEKYLLRRMIATCTEAVATVYEHEGDVSAILDALEEKILGIRPKASEAKDIKALIREAQVLIETRAKDWNAILGMSTGIGDLDRLTDGVHGGELIVIGAPTSCGKTSLALNIIAHNALLGIPSAMMSAEMQPVKLALRSLCAEARVNFKRMGDDDIRKLIVATGKIAKSPIHIESINGNTIGQVRAKARRLKQQHGIRILAVENIQLLTGKGDNREQQIANVSQGLKGMALELDLAVIGLSQLNDDMRVRESRAIGHDADSVWIISNPKDQWEPSVQPVYLDVQKCRDGETGRVNLTFLKEITRFEQTAKINDDDVPR